MSDNIIPEGAILTCTNALRWVKKYDPPREFPHGPLAVHQLPRLQQAWQDRATGAIEWRDVETVVEINCES